MTAHELAQRLAKKQGLDPARVFILILVDDVTQEVRAQAWYSNGPKPPQLLATTDFVSDLRFAAHGLRQELRTKLKEHGQRKQP